MLSLVGQYQPKPPFIVPHRGKGVLKGGKFAEDVFNGSSDRIFFA
jgi:hypothetical protein